MLLVVFLCYTIIFHFAKIPIGMANWLVPFKVESPQHIPISVDHQYAQISGLDRVQLVYENEYETLTVWVTSEIGWVNRNHMDETFPLTTGQLAYYTEIDGIQMLSFRKGSVEYAIDFAGDSYLSQEEFINIASSIK